MIKIKLDYSVSFETVVVVNLSISTSGPPTISRIYPELVARPSGYQATSFCEAHGLSPFNLTWSREHGRMSRYVKSNIEESMKGKYFSKRTYIKFEKLSYRDIGNYRCIADNMAGIAVRRVKVKIQGIVHTCYVSLNILVNKLFCLQVSTNTLLHRSFASILISQ